MRWLIEYVKSCFCKHEWELIFNTRVEDDFETYTCKVYRCKKCGYAKKYKSH